MLLFSVAAVAEALKVEITSPYRTDFLEVELTRQLNSINVTTLDSSADFTPLCGLINYLIY